MGIPYFYRQLIKILKILNYEIGLIDILKLILVARVKEKVYENLIADVEFK